jgi:hypothetical protein
MKQTHTLIVSEADLKRRTDYYLQKVEREGTTLLIERDGVIAAQITPPLEQSELVTD